MLSKFSRNLTNFRSNDQNLHQKFPAFFYKLTCATRLAEINMLRIRSLFCRILQNAYWSFQYSVNSISSAGDSA